MRAAEIALLLPDVYRRSAPPGSVLAAVLDVMEQLHQPSEDVLSAFEEYLDPLVTPTPFVRLLATWVDLERLDAAAAGQPSLDVERMRLLVHLAAPLGGTRGTAEGLRLAVRAATGLPECRVLATGPFTVRVELPGATPAQLELARAVVHQERPAHILAEVTDGGPDTGEPPA